MKINHFVTLDAVPDPDLREGAVDRTPNEPESGSAEPQPTAPQDGGYWWQTPDRPGEGAMDVISQLWT